MKFKKQLFVESMVGLFSFAVIAALFLLTVVLSQDSLFRKERPIEILFDDAMAGSTYGSYTSLVYLLPLLGGIMADRFIGTRKAVAFGALLLVAGHAMMAFEGRPATETLAYAGQT